LSSANAASWRCNMLNGPEDQTLYMLIYRLVLVRPHVKLGSLAIQVGVHCRVMRDWGILILFDALHSNKSVASTSGPES
jgi:hypothetical protein